VDSDIYSSHIVLNESVAFDIIYSQAHPLWFENDLEVSLSVGSENFLFSEIAGGNNEIDSDGDLEALKRYFNDFKNKEIENSKPSIEDFEKLKSAIDGKSLSVGGEIFSLDAVLTEDG